MSLVRWRWRKSVCRLRKLMALNKCENAILCENNDNEE